MKPLDERDSFIKGGTGVYMRKKSLHRSKRKREISMKHKLAATAVAIGLLSACVSAQSAGQATGTVDRYTHGVTMMRGMAARHLSVEITARATRA